MGKKFLKESFEVTRLVKKFDRRTGKSVINVSYRTRTQVTPRTVAVAEAFGVGVDDIPQQSSKMNEKKILALLR